MPKALVIPADDFAPVEIRELATADDYTAVIGHTETVRLTGTLRLAGQPITVEIFARSFYKGLEDVRDVKPNHRATHALQRRLYGSVIVVGLLNTDVPLPECFELEST